MYSRSHFTMKLDFLFLEGLQGCLCMPHETWGPGACFLLLSEKLPLTAADCKGSGKADNGTELT